MVQPTSYCPSCRCGWHRALDAFTVNPPESICLNPQCQCHESFWQYVDLEQIDELEKRRLYGDR